MAALFRGLLVRYLDINDVLRITSAYKTKIFTFEVLLAENDVCPCSIDDTS